MPDKPTVASIQMDCILNDKEASLNRTGALVENIVEKGAQLVTLPRPFNTGYRVGEYDTVLAEPIPGVATQWMHQLAVKHYIYIAGAIIESGENGILYDTAVVVGPKGFKGKHWEIHL